MVIPIHIYPVIMQKCLPFILYFEVCCQVNFLQTCERMSAYWAIKVYVFVKQGVWDIERNMEKTF